MADKSDFIEFDMKIGTVQDLQELPHVTCHVSHVIIHLFIHLFIYWTKW